MRYILALIVAPLVVVAIITLMIQLVRYQPVVEDEPEPQPQVTIDFPNEPAPPPKPEQQPEVLSPDPISEVPPMPTIDIDILDAPVQQSLPKIATVDNVNQQFSEQHQAVLGSEQGADAQQRLQPLYRVEPKYPGKARRLALEGWVELMFDVNGLGDVENIRVVDSQPKRTFEREASKALAQWKFRPMVFQGQKQRVNNRRVVIEFQLN